MARESRLTSTFRIVEHETASCNMGTLDAFAAARESVSGAENVPHNRGLGGFDLRQARRRRHG